MRTASARARTSPVPRPVASSIPSLCARRSQRHLRSLPKSPTAKFSTPSNTSNPQGRGPKKHLKRLAAPSSWLLDKLGGTYAPRPSPGPHKLRESLPLTVFLRNRLKYALTGKEVTAILMQRLVKVDGKVRTDETYPAGFMGG